MWSEKELNILKDNYARLCIDDLRNMLPNRTLTAIFLKANKMGLKREIRDSKNIKKIIALNKYVNC